MGSEWEEVTTFENLIAAGVLEIGDGYRAKNSELGGQGVMFLRAGHVRDTHIDFSGVDRFDQKVEPRVAGKRARPGDTVITTKGNSTGRTTFVTEAMPPFVYSPHLSYWRSTDTERLNPGFLRYWSRSAEFQSQLAAMAGSTDMAPYLSLRDQKRLEMFVPHISHQREVEKILGTLDDKIELNRRMSETLEAMARALFKSWFVDFDPVRAKAEGRDTGLPKKIADLFPDSFEDSELGEIPKGWRVGVLGDVAEHPRRSVKPDEFDPETPYIALEHMPRRATTLGQWGCAEGVESNKHAFEQGEILFGKLRPYFHKVGVAPVSGICSTDIVVLRPIDPEMHGFVLGVVSSDEFVDITSAGATGTRMPRTNWDQMKDYPVVVPSPAVAYAFDRIVGLGIRRAIAGTHESLALAQLRDTLLPELITRRNVGLVTG